MRPHFTFVAQVLEAGAERSTNCDSLRLDLRKFLHRFRSGAHVIIRDYL
ncbi:MAG: hypothetical protein L0387_26165 [Acidobacteria bacterium]|nr:hypothetical protein [Acidobacteriota bacterium]